MIETEIKLRLPDSETGRSKLLHAGFSESKPRVFEINLVLDTPAFDLRNSARLLRLRSAGDLVTLTLKGPPQPGPHKQRPEFETRIENFQSGIAIFGMLGYKPVFRYEKYRTEFNLPGEEGHALLDETPIGCFIELEGAGPWIDAWAAKLGFTKDDYVLDSYGALYLARCRATGVAPSDMVFEQA